MYDLLPVLLDRGLGVLDGVLVQGEVRVGIPARVRVPPVAYE